jgi:arylsulfatase B/arylsulfatase I/J
MDELAADGIKLNRHYAMPVCTPTRAALLTGKHPVQLGMQHWQIMPSEPWGLDTSEHILPQYLKEDGSYETHALGKWHLGHYKESLLPMRRGFDSFTGFLGGGEDYSTKLSQDSCVTGDDGVEKCAYDFRHGGSKYVVQDDNETFNTYILGNMAIETMTNHSLSDSNNPLFMYLPFPNPHAPVTRAPGMEDREDLLNTIPNPYRRDYASLLLALDDTIAQIIDTAKETGLYDNSYFIFLSDNGADVPSGGNNYPLRGAKNTLFEGGVRTPAFIHSPLLSEDVKGKTFDGMFHVSDWLPTILGGMMERGIEERTESNNWYGLNQWDALTNPSMYEATTTTDGESQDSTVEESSIEYPRSELLLNIDYLDSEGHVSDNVKVGLIKDGYKFILSEVGLSTFPVPTDEQAVVENRLRPSNYLFDLNEDPNETTNLIGKERDITKGFREDIKEYIDTMLRPSKYRPPDDDAWRAWEKDDTSEHPLLAPWLNDNVPEGMLTSTMLQNYPDRWAFESNLPTDDD